MTTIDTYAVKVPPWKDECEYLERIEFAALNSDGKISIITDEEGNDEIILTPKAARWVVLRLAELVKIVEDKKKAKKA